MKEKNYLMLGMMLLIIFSMFSFISAEMLVSDAGVEYEQRILDEFAKSDESFINIIIQLKDPSETDNLISDFSEDEIRKTFRFSTSDDVSAEISESGFEKLIEDGRVDKIYFNRPLTINEPKNNPDKGLLVILSILGLFILFILIIYSIKKLKNKKRKK
jgi:hypothetical protein